MDKRELTLAELDGELALELPRRDTLQVGIGGGGLVGIGIGAVNVNVPITVQDNNICVNVAAVVAAAGCDQDT